MKQTTTAYRGARESAAVGRDPSPAHCVIVKGYTPSLHSHLYERPVIRR